jgi:hypothetical protein
MNWKSHTEASAIFESDPDSSHPLYSKLVSHKLLLHIRFSVLCIQF